MIKDFYFDGCESLFDAFYYEPEVRLSIKLLLRRTLLRSVILFSALQVHYWLQPFLIYTMQMKFAG